MPRGGFRQNSGRKTADGRDPRPAQPRLATNNGRLVIPDELIEAIREMGGGKKRRDQHPELNPFQVRSFHPPNVKVPKEHQMAMDDANGWASSEWSGGAAGNYLGQVFAQGLAFPGYPFLSELAQRAEYDAFSEIFATEMTRKWIKLKGRTAKTGDPDEKADDIRDLEDFMVKINVRDAYKSWLKYDGLMGRAHLFHEIDGNYGQTPASVTELASSIGDGSSELSASKVNKAKPLTGIRTMEPVWTYPTTYNANNPLAPDFYRPQIWYTIGGIQMHISRLLLLIGRPVPDLLKPAYSFGGISLSQLMMPYVDIWLETRESIGRLIHAFSTMVLETDLQTLMQPGGGDLMRRVALFNAVRDNNQTFVINKMTEGFSNVSVPLGTLDALQAQAQEHLSSISRIPVAVYTGISPTGLNASSEGEIRIWENTVHSYQEARMRKALTSTIHFCMLSLWGKIDPDIVFDFVPLREMTEKENAEINKLKAETDDLLMNGCQAIGPDEVRVRVASDVDSGYDNIDPEDEPEMPEQPELPGMGGAGGGKINLTGHTAAGGKTPGAAKPKPKS